MGHRRHRDDQFISVPAERPDLTLHGYYLTTNFHATSYAVLRMTRLDRPWHWTGVVHEHLALQGAEVGSLDAPRVHEERAGARSKDPGTYRRDAELLEGALAKTPDDPRVQFYLAQSWRDTGERQHRGRRAATVTGAAGECRHRHQHTCAESSSPSKKRAEASGD